MTDSLRISSGARKILINDGPEFIEVNASDVVFVERFYAVIREFEAKLEEYKTRGTQIDEKGEVDSAGIPVNLADRIEFIREVCEFMNAKIDQIFGIGTAKKVFGETMSLDMYEQFFNGLEPFIRSARTERVSKYAPNRKGKVLK